MRVLLVLLLVSCNSNKLGSTPEGTVVIHWDANPKTDFYLEQSSITDRRFVETTHAVTELKRELTFRTSVELATVTMTIGSETTVYTAPLRVSSVVVDSDDTTLATGDCSRLRPGPVKDGVAQLFVECSFGMKRKTSHEGFEGGADFVVCGGGRVVQMVEGSSWDLCK